MNNSIHLLKNNYSIPRQGFSFLLFLSRRSPSLVRRGSPLRSPLAAHWRRPPGELLRPLPSVRRPVAARIHPDDRRKVRSGPAGKNSNSLLKYSFFYNGIFFFRRTRATRSSTTLSSSSPASTVRKAANQKTSLRREIWTWWPGAACRPP